MPSTIAGKAKIQLPIGKSVGAQHQAPGIGGDAPPQVAVPGPTALAINGKAVVIDVRTMSGGDVVKAINTAPGVTASIDGAGRLMISGVSSIEGDGNLRAILGI